MAKDKASLLPEYLMLWMSRPETQRISHSRYNCTEINRKHLQSVHSPQRNQRKT